jgi:hypothetical protein
MDFILFCLGFVWQYELDKPDIYIYIYTNCDVLDRGKERVINEGLTFATTYPKADS